MEKLLPCQNVVLAVCLKPGLILVGFKRRMAPAAYPAYIYLLRRPDKRSAIRQ